MPLGAIGSAAKFYWKEESSEGTAATGNYEQFPAFALSVGAVTGLQSDSLLSANARRNAADPYRSVARVEGSARVPVDTVHFGKWLKMLLGAPTTTGAANYTHTFKSGGTSFTTRTVEKAFPSITRYELVTGVRANSIELSIAPDGAAQATIGLLCLNETHAGSSGAGTPTTATFARFHQVQGSINRGGTALAGVTGGNIRFSNGLAAVPTVGSGTGIGGIDLGECTGGGSVTLRFNNHTEEALARAGTATTLDFALTIDSNTSVQFVFSRIFLEPTSVAVDGPGGITRSYNFIAADDSTDASLMKVIYKNQTATY